MTSCIKCTRQFIKLNEQYCKDCYELQILKGQCLNLAGMLLKDKYNPEHSDFPEKLVILTKTLFDTLKKTEIEKKRFLAW